jgi:tetratricopeptide (TPR) repeat protein
MSDVRLSIVTSYQLILIERQANALKDLGNKAFAARDYNKAIDLFSQAIAVDPKNHVLWSNRSAAKAGKKDWSGALADADEVCSAPSNHNFYLIIRI